jgi:hypothetical protein
VKLVRPLILPVLVVAVMLATASPAFAAGGPVAEAAKPWHYWIAFVLIASALGIALIALPIGYLFKVWLPKHRGR